MPITPYKSLEHALEWVEWTEFSLPPMPPTLNFDSPADWMRDNMASNEELKISVWGWKHLARKAYDTALNAFWDSEERRANSWARLEADCARRRFVDDTLGHPGTFIKFASGEIRLVGDQDPSFYDHGYDYEFDDDTVDRVVAYARLWPVALTQN